MVRAQHINPPTNNPKTFLDRTGTAIDRLIGMFAPQAELTRMKARIRSRNVRMYAAAKTTRLTGDWPMNNTDVNSLIRMSAPMIRSRTRQLVRDFPYFARAINILTDYTVGDGIKYQARIKNLDGTLDKKTNQKIEDAVKFWMDEADIAGKLHYFELERLAKRQETEAGEYLFIKNYKKGRKRYIPFCLQPVESDWLSDLYTKPQANTLVDQGIEYFKATGEPVTYHFMIPDGFNLNLTGAIKSIPVKAENVLHGFETLRPGQMRGISPFATAILVAHDLADFLDAEIDGAKLAAKYLAFIKTNDPGGMQVNRMESDEEDSDKKIETMENAILEYLQPGEDITLADHNRPGDSFTPFTKFVLRMIAVATGVSYELLSGDYDGISYSNLRGIRNDVTKAFRHHIRRHVTHFSTPVIHTVIDTAVMAGRLDLPGYYRNPYHYLAGDFVPPGMESIDPLREGKAHIEQIKAGLRSPQEIVASRGRDFEEVIKEIAEAKRLTEEQDLEWMPTKTSTAMQQNPAKIGAN